MPWPENLLKSVRKDEPLAEHTSLGIGGAAEFYAEPRDEGEVATLLRAAAGEGLRVRVIGAGTNLLVPDEGVKGLVVSADAMAGRPERKEENRLWCRSGARLGEVVRVGMDSGFAGVESLAGIPGSVGGAVVCNAGAGEQATGDFVRGVEFVNFDGQGQRLERDELEFGYRKGPKVEGVITKVELAFERTDPEVVRKEVLARLEARRKSQPVSASSAGCVFKNPTAASAGELIEKAGLKGARVGGAEVSREHANYIVNLGTARAEDVKALIELVEAEVYERFGAKLELEIEVW